MKKISKSTLATTLSTAFLATAIAPKVSADANPFSATELQSGYETANFAHADMPTINENCKDSEGKCGEGKCGEGKFGSDKGKEGKCGEGKCGEGKCGGDK